KAFRVFNSRTRIVQETLHVNFLKNKPNVAGSGPVWLFDIDSLTKTMNYHPVIAENQSNSHVGFQDTEKAEEEGTHTYVLFLVLSDGSTNSQNNNKDALIDGKEHDDDIQKSVSSNIHSSSSVAQTRKQECTNNSSNGVNAASSSVSTTGHNFINNTNDFSAAGPSNAAASPTATNSSDMPNLEDLTHSDDADDVGLQVKQKKDGIFISQDKYVAEILKKFGLSEGKSASTPIDAEKPLLKDTDVKRIFRYLKGKPYLGLWYPKDSPFDLVAYSDSDYAGASLDRKSTTRGCQFLGCRLISWQCKKQTVVATSSTEAEYVAAASGCAQVLWIQNQLLDYGVFNPPMLHLLRVEMVINSPWMLSKNWLVQKQTAFGVNTPRSDEDRLKLMELMVFLLQKGWKLHALCSYSESSYIHLMKKIVISEDVIREILQLDDAEGVVCLPNEEIFAGLAQTGYEKPSTKPTFYKAFFSSQWKFLIHSFLHLLSAKRTFWNEFITTMASANQVGDLSTHTTRYISPALTQKVFANMRWVGKGFSGIETPLFKGMLAARHLVEEGIAEEQVQADVAVAATVQDNVAEDKLEIIKLKARVKRLERANKVKSSKLRRLRKVGASRRIESSDDMEDVFNQERMIDDLDKDEGIALDDSEVQEVVEVVTTDKLITYVVIAASQDSGASATISAAKPSILAAALTVVTAYTRRRKRVIIRDLEEELSLKNPVKTPKLKDKDKGILIETPKPMKKKDQIELDAEYARKLHEEINKDHEEINRILIGMMHLIMSIKNPRILNDEDDDVFIEATPLARKVPVVDYQIVLIDNKPRFKIIKADETHQLYISFITLLKNFEREDLKNLWGIVKERFSTSRPTNYF
nr:uncharacterized mitochondrial protein AtMg00810-like [Tanacetum cinerariifolium]